MTMTKSDPERGERRRQQEEVAESLRESGTLDEIFARIDAGELLTGHAGLLKGMLKASLERGLDVELSDHVGYDRGDPDAALFENSRNGTFPKTVATARSAKSSWPFSCGTVRGRSCRCWSPRGSRRLDGLDAMIVSLYAGGDDGAPTSPIISSRRSAPSCPPRRSPRSSTAGPSPGTFAGELYTRDGSLPDPGVCEPAWARVTVTGALRGFLRLRATGEVCGEFLQPPTSLATHRFTGRYRVMSSSRPAVVGTEGSSRSSLPTTGGPACSPSTPERTPRCVGSGSGRLGRPSVNGRTRQ